MGRLMVRKVPGEHSISDIDEEARQGVCAVCGPVKLCRRRSPTPGRWRYYCEVKDRANRNRQRYRPKKRRGTHGLTVAERRDMVLANPTCAICLQDVDLRIGRVDHCHKTGRIRGVLCNNCNTGIGMLRDDATLLRAAASYLDGRLV